MRQLWVVVALLLAGLITGCQDTTPSPSSPTGSGECWDNATTQLELNECAAQDHSQAADELARLLSELQQVVSPQMWAELEAVQTDWATYSEAHCTWAAQFFEGGSIAAMEYRLCLSGLTLHRIDELKIYLCEGAGLSGPCDASEAY
jgi:uncharacterized protein YecT (DUF1311 family)